MTLIAPGTWFEAIPLTPAQMTIMGPGASVNMPEGAFRCEAVVPTERLCVFCGPMSVGLKLKGFERFLFCANHWKPVYRESQSFVAQLDAGLYNAPEGPRREDGEPQMRAYRAAMWAEMKRRFHKDDWRDPT